MSATSPGSPETPEGNPIHNAIDVLHAAFVGTPAEDAGTPIDFAQDITETQPEVAPWDEDSRRESLTLEEAILRECPGVGTSVRAIGYATGMKSEHIVLAAEGSPLLAVDASSEGLGLGAIIRATEAGRARAAELGWTDAVGPDPEEASRTQEMVAEQTLPAPVTQEEPSGATLLGRIEQLEAAAEGFREWATTQQVWTRGLEAEVQTLRAAAAVAAADSTRVFDLLESLHRALGALFASDAVAR